MNDQLEPSQPKVSILLILMLATGDQMKRISLYKTLAIAGMVINLGFGSVGWGQATGVTGSSGTGPSPWPQPKTKEDSCKEAINQVNLAKSNFMSACELSNSVAGDSQDEKPAKSTAVGCQNLLESCKKMQTTQMPIVPGLEALNLLVEDGDPKCANMVYTDYKSALREANRDVKDDQKSVKEVEKDAHTADKEFSEQQVRIKKEVADSTKKNQEEMLALAEEERTQQAKKLEAITALTDKLSAIQSKILETSNSKQLLITQQANQVEDYKVEILSCKASTLEYEKKLKSNTSASLSSGMYGSLSSANARSAASKKDIQEFWQICVNKVLRARDNRGQAYLLKLKEFDQQIATLGSQQDQLTKSKALLESHSASADTDRVKKKDQLNQNFQDEMKRRTEEFRDAVALYGNQKAKLAKDLKIANEAVVASGNILDQMKKEKVDPGTTKTAKEAAATFQVYAYTECNSVCGSIKEMAPTCLAAQPSPSTSSTGANSTGAATGTAK